MGATIGAIVIALELNSLDDVTGIFATTVVFSLVGTVCAFICSELAKRLDYFGGQEFTSLFLLSGAIPAFIGGWIYGWLLITDKGQRMLLKYGI